MTRLEANLKILDILKEYAKSAPDQRFHQILQNIGLEDGPCDDCHDRFFEESTETLTKLKSLSSF